MLSFWKSISRGLGLSVVAVGTLWGASSARAGQIDLTVAPYNGHDDQGAYFYRSDLQPTGTGVIKPFLTIQEKGMEHGYNSDSTNTSLLLDDHRAPSQWVRSVKIDDIAAVPLAGHSGLYAQFFLDLNESNSDDHLLSMDKFQLFSTTDPNLTGYHETSILTGQPGDGFTSAETTLYDMDKLSDWTVQLNYSLNHGSGSGDMKVYIPYSVIQSQLGQNKYLVLYTSFGKPYASSAGFEEWSVLTGAHPGPPVPGPGVPLPSTGAGGAVVLGLLGIRRRSRRK